MPVAYLLVTMLFFFIVMLASGVLLPWRYDLERWQFHLVLFLFLFSFVMVAWGIVILKGWRIQNESIQSNRQEHVLQTGCE